MASGARPGTGAAEAGNARADADAAPEATNRSNRRWRLFFKRRAGVIALAILIALYLIALLGPLVYRVSPTDTDPLATTLPPSAHHLLGTDELGRDELARILSGGRLSLTLGLMSVFIAVGLGTLAGLVAGFYRGLVEMAIMRLVDVAMAIPTFFLILIEITVFGNTAPVIIAVIGLTYWAQVARIMHGETTALREREFVTASEALGASQAGIM